MTDHDPKCPDKGGVLPLGDPDKGPSLAVVHHDDCHTSFGIMFKGHVAARVPGALPVMQDGSAYRLADAGNGPAQVASEEYRTGWERIFGARQERGQA
jgi:hypothetical protein